MLKQVVPLKSNAIENPRQGCWPLCLFKEKIENQEDGLYEILIFFSGNKVAIKYTLNEHLIVL